MPALCPTSGRRLSAAARLRAQVLSCALASGFTAFLVSAATAGDWTVALPPLRLSDPFKGHAGMTSGRVPAAARPNALLSSTRPPSAYRPPSPPLDYTVSVHGSVGFFAGGARTQMTPGAR